MKVRIKKDGTIWFIYNDRLRGLIDEGTAEITRASHVEPDPEKVGFWMADMSPVGGPVQKDFELREQALAWEIQWLEANGLGESREKLAASPESLRSSAESPNFANLPKRENDFHFHYDHSPETVAEYIRTHKPELAAEMAALEASPSKEDRRDD